MDSGSSTSFVVTTNPTALLPLGTDTDFGTLAFGPLDCRTTSKPPAGAGASNCTCPLTELPPVTCALPRRTADTAGATASDASPPEVIPATAARSGTATS